MIHRRSPAPLRKILCPYTSSLSRIVRLTIDVVIDDDDQTLVRLGDPPSPVPQPFAALLDYTARRTNMSTATNPGATWLCPRRRAGQPLRPEYLAKLIHQLRVPTVAGRSAAIRQHVLDMPAPIVAHALGHHHVTTAKLATQAGATWSRYAPGDYSQPPSPRTRDS